MTMTKTRRPSVHTWKLCFVTILSNEYKKNRIEKLADERKQLRSPSFYLSRRCYEKSLNTAKMLVSAAFSLPADDFL